jgi:plastocyanin
MRRRLLLLVLLAALLPAATVLEAGTLSGRIAFVDKDGKPARGVDPTHTVVSFEAAGAKPVTGAGRVYQMVTRGKEFLPQVLPVLKGSSVRFPNQDPILHNVFSVSSGNPFDLGLYGRGDGKSWVFQNPGVVRLFCNVHHAMVAYVVVLETPHFVVPGREGRFSLANLPNGPGRLMVWHPQAEPLVLETRGDAPLPEIRLKVTRVRVPPHLNKDGKAYARPGTSRYD